MSDIRDRLKRTALLQHLLEVYRDPDDDKVHEVPIWEEWLYRTGELPPDFDRLPSQAALPDVLRFLDGSKVTAAESWPARRAEILETLHTYLLGRWPEHLAWRSQEIESFEDEELGCTRQRLDLLLGPTQEAVTKLSYTGPASYQAAYLKIEVAIPRGRAPFPVLVGPDFRRYGGQPGSWRVPDPARYRTRDVYHRAIERGYVTCTFSHHDAFACRNVFTGHDCTELVWWAWGISRCIDYLYTLSEVDRSRIAVAGHSRGGMTSLYALALDERVAAGVVSHTGAGQTLRYAAEKYGSQTLEVRTRLFPHMSHPRLRFFCGREFKLPFDGHFVLSLAAPRSLLITEGDQDPVGELMGAQQSFLAAKEVYALLNAEERINMAIDPGGHSLTDEAMERWMDWLDLQFRTQDRTPATGGRLPVTQEGFESQLMYDYTFARWQQRTGVELDVTKYPQRGLDDPLLLESGRLVATSADWQARRREIAARLHAVLGRAPAHNPPTALFLEREHVYDQYWTFRTEGGLVADRLALDGGLVCQLAYREADAQREPLPVVIYCHQYNDQRGFAWQRHEQAGIHVTERLADNGFLAVEFDLFGYGTRNHDAGLAYWAAHPDRSALGVMVGDVRQVVDALSGLRIADPGRVALVGYSLGGAVALHAAALDERVGACVSVCGMGSMRLDAHGEATEGLGRYCLLRPTLPRLGFFLGQEQRVPYDYHELLSLIAPRPVLIVAPTLDQDWFHEDVRACYEAALPIYAFLAAPNAIEFRAPHDFNRYPPKLQDEVNVWLGQWANAANSKKA